MLESKIFIFHHLIEFLIFYEFVHKVSKIPVNLEKMFVNNERFQKQITKLVFLFINDKS